MLYIWYRTKHFLRKEERTRIMRLQSSVCCSSMRVEEQRSLQKIEEHCVSVVVELRRVFQLMCVCCDCAMITPAQNKYLHTGDAWAFTCISVCNKTFDGLIFLDEGCSFLAHLVVTNPLSTNVRRSSASYASLILETKCLLLSPSVHKNAFTLQTPTF